MKLKTLISALTLTTALLFTSTVSAQVSDATFYRCGEWTAVDVGQSWYKTVYDGCAHAENRAELAKVWGQFGEDWFNSLPADVQTNPSVASNNCAALLQSFHEGTLADICPVPELELPLCKDVNQGFIPTVKCRHR